MTVQLPLDARGYAVPIAHVIDDTGEPVDIDSLQQTLTYTDGVLTSIAATDGTNTWTQTLTYTSGNLTGISAWVRS